jgi:hypothetical protein
LLQLRRPLLGHPLLLIQDLAVLRQALFVLMNQILLFPFCPALILLRRLLLSSPPPSTLSRVLVFLLSVFSLSLGVGGHAEPDQGHCAESHRHEHPMQDIDSHRAPL